MELLISEAMKIMPPGQVLVLVMLAFIMKLIRDVRDQFRLLNGSVKELKAWATHHEKQDDQRHEEVKQGQRDVWAEMGSLRRRTP